MSILLSARCRQLWLTDDYEQDDDDCSRGSQQAILSVQCLSTRSVINFTSGLRTHKESEDGDEGTEMHGEEMQKGRGQSGRCKSSRSLRSETIGSSSLPLRRERVPAGHLYVMRTH